MPKFSATLASLLLIASSIGVNIARYPQVGRTVDTGQQTDTAGTANSAPAAQQPGVDQTAHPDSLPARETGIEPAKSRQVAAVTPPESTHGRGSFDSGPAAGTARPLPEPAVTILDMRPMVPVASLRAAGGTANPPAGYDEVQRLPPVEPRAAVAETQATGPDAAQPYETTSTP